MMRKSERKTANYELGSEKILTGFELSVCQTLGGRLNHCATEIFIIPLLALDSSLFLYKNCQFCAQTIERFRIMFTANDKRQFLPCDQVFSLLVVLSSLYLRKN